MRIPNHRITKRRNIKVNKEKYITPEIRAFEMKDTDIIRTSIFEIDSDDELDKVDSGYGTSIDDLFK